MSYSEPKVTVALQILELLLEVILAEMMGPYSSSSRRSWSSFSVRLGRTLAMKAVKLSL
jgi:hypothetical protein